MQIFNTMTRAKETFETRQPGKVAMYVCGITAYDLCHIGHARSAVVFDVLARHLHHLGYDVTFVRNFTDVDDKIIRRANAEGVPSGEIATRYIEAFTKTWTGSASCARAPSPGPPNISPPWPSWPPAWWTAATPTGPPRATSISGCAPSPATASSPAATSKTCGPEPG